MKKIEAIIKPYKLEEVRSALTGLGISYVTMSEVESCGRRNAASQHEARQGIRHGFFVLKSSWRS